MNNALLQKKREAYKKSRKLRDCYSANPDCSFDRAQELRKEQQKEYDKYLFLKGLSNAIEKQKKK